MTESQARQLALKKRCRRRISSGCGWPRCHCREGGAFIKGWNASAVFKRPSAVASREAVRQLNDTIAELWAQGFSASQIGDKLDLTKNQVMGRVYRLKLPRHIHARVKVLYTKKKKRTYVAEPEYIALIGDIAPAVRFEKLVRGGANTKLLAKIFDLTEAEALAKARAIERRAA